MTKDEIIEKLVDARLKDHSLRLYLLAANSGDYIGTLDAVPPNEIANDKTELLVWRATETDVDNYIRTDINFKEAIELLNKYYDVSHKRGEGYGK